MSIKRNKIQSSLCFLSIFFMLFTVNHCAFEEVFFSIKSIVGLESSMDHTNNSAHNEGDSESHEHGQPHQIFAASVINNFTSATLAIFLILPFFIISFISLYSKSSKSDVLINNDVISNYLYRRRELISLSLAPQAPPLNLI